MKIEKPQNNSTKYDNGDMQIENYNYINEIPLRSTFGASEREQIDTVETRPRQYK